MAQPVKCYEHLTGHSIRGVRPAKRYEHLAGWGSALVLRMRVDLALSAKLACDFVRDVRHKARFFKVEL